MVDVDVGVAVRVAVGGTSVAVGGGNVAVGGTAVGGGNVAQGVSVGGGFVGVRVAVFAIVAVGGAGVLVRVMVGVREGGEVGVALFATRTPTRPA